MLTNNHSSTWIHTDLTSFGETASCNHPLGSCRRLGWNQGTPDIPAGRSLLATFTMTPPCACSGTHCRQQMIQDGYRAVRSNIVKTRPQDQTDHKPARPRKYRIRRPVCEHANTQKVPSSLAQLRQVSPCQA